MLFKYAAKLHNGDEVHVRKSVTGKDQASSAKVLNAYLHPTQRNTMLLDVLLDSGEYLQALCHRDLL